MTDFFDFDLAAAYEEIGDELTTQILPKGEYEVEVLTAEPGRTKAGDPKINVQFAVTSGPYAGRRLFDNLNWIKTKKDGTPNEFGLKMTQRALAMMGATPEWVRLENATGWVGVADRIVGAHLLLTVTEGEYMGEPQNNIKYKKALDGPVGGAAQAPTLGAPQQQQQQQQAPQGQAPSNSQFPTL